MNMPIFSPLYKSLQAALPSEPCETVTTTMEVASEQPELEVEFGLNDAGLSNA